MWHYRARLLALLLPLTLGIGLTAIWTIAGEASGAPAAPMGGGPAGLVLTPTRTLTPTPTATPTRTPCPVPGCGVDFAIGVDANGDTTLDCASDGTPPAKCTLPLGATFRLGVFLDKGGVSSYQGYDLRVTYAGVASKDNPDLHYWPDCVLQAVLRTQPPGSVVFGCGIGLFDPSSTYTGLIAVSEFNCIGSGSITLVNGPGETGLTEKAGSVYYDSEAQEPVTINCNSAVTATPTSTPTPGPSPTPTPTRDFKASPTPTPTPGGPTATQMPTGTPPPGASPTPTPTPTPTTPGAPTATRTPAPTGGPSATPTPTRNRTPTPTRTPGGAVLYGDVNCDERVSAVDALFVLQFDVGIIAGLPCAAAGNVNSDRVTNSLDALLILQFDAGIIDELPAGSPAAGTDRTGR